MTRLVRVIHVFLPLLNDAKTWMARINRAMTTVGCEKRGTRANSTIEKTPLVHTPTNPLRVLPRTATIA